MRSFKTIKSGFYKMIFLLGLLPLLLLFFFISNFNSAGRLNMFVGGLIIMSILILCLWFWYGTRYFIDGDKLKIYFGPLSWKICVNEIRLIELDQKVVRSSWWAASLAMKGIVIHYRTSMIFISPEQQNSFLESLKSLNNEIQIK